MVMLTDSDTDMHGDADTVIQTCMVMPTDSDADMHGDADTHAADKR